MKTDNIILANPKADYKNIDELMTDLYSQNVPFAGREYCPECHHNRIMLNDSLHSKGMTRKVNHERKQSAREIIANCPTCQTFFGGN